jgi:polar amino acid transport system substrate-binding protein
MKTYPFLLLPTCVLFILLGAFRPTGTSWAADPLIISGHPDYPPFMWNQNGQLIGIGPSLAKAICLELNIPCEFRPIDSWARVQELAKSGEIDLITGAYSNEERRTYMDYTIAYMMDSTIIIVHKDRPLVFHKREDLIGKKGVAMFGESYGQELDSFIEKNLFLTRTYTTDASFNNLEKGNVDYMLWGYYPWLAHARALNTPDWCLPQPIPIAQEGMHLTLSRKSHYRTHLPAMNAIIKRFQQDGTLERWREEFTKMAIPVEK